MRLALRFRLQTGATPLLFASLVGSGCGENGGTDVVLPALSIRTSTSGTEIDPDGYSVQVDGFAVQRIGAAATVTVDRLPEGEHTVTLSGVAPNCAVEGENPKAVTVTSGATATVAFTVTCGAAMGAIEVGVSTSGSGTDPDGYSLVLDGGDRGPIGLNATTTVGGIQSGPHTIGLTGLAANCQVGGENPRAVTVVAGETVQLAFAVACAIPGPTVGSLEISVTTSGPDQDSDGYQVSIDGGANQPVGTNAIFTLANVSAVQHTVLLVGLAPNCAVQGENPIGAAVPAGGIARVTFSVNCAATAGGLTITVAGLPSGTAAAVTVRGPGDYSQAVTETGTLTGLTPGSYTVSASRVVSGGTTYTPSVGRPSVDVAAGTTTDVTVGYTAETEVTLNLRIDGLHITQSTQTYGSDVPLIAGREAYLRVFVVANESNSARPGVRVRLSRPGAATWTRTISAPRSSTPTEVEEGTLNQSWNLEIPASQIRPGLTIEAEVDQAETIEESNEADNRFPASGTKALTVRSVSPARIRFISVQQGSSAPGNVSNPEQLINLARRMHPLNVIDVDVDPAVFPASVPLESNGNGWNQLLSDLDGKRVAEGSDRIYFGVVKLEYGRQAGMVGLTLGQGIPTAAGWDDPSDASRVVAHELGHVWGRKHSPCGGPPDLDGLYPYSGGTIGVYGLDVTSTDLKPASSPDIMSYCFQNPWISDYTYREVMAFRAGATATARVAAVPQPSLLVWGRIENGRPVLEPAFQIVTRPSLPGRPGPYSVTGTANDGSQLFSFSFDAATTVDHGSGSGGHFAFAVPLDPARANRIATLKLAGPGGSTARSRAAADLRTSGAQQSIAVQREGQSVALRWNASVHPTIMVRDPDTGEVLSFARGGSARVWTTKGEVDVVLSDGVRSQSLRRAISRP